MENIKYFEESEFQALNYYVYILIDPRNEKPFYVGKGNKNRVFDHCVCALEDMETTSDKYNLIREIIAEGLQVKHVIVRNGLTEKIAFDIEASLIDTLSYCNILLSNVQGGHHSLDNGLMTADEIKRKYNAPKLESMRSDCILININKSYQRGFGTDPIYQATKSCWFISESKLPNIKYVLSEFNGLIVEVFEVIDWYSCWRTKNKTINKEKNKKKAIKAQGFGFNGIVAPLVIRSLYINKSVKHIKQRGAAQVIRYNIKSEI